MDGTVVLLLSVGEMGHDWLWGVNRLLYSRNGEAMRRERVD